MICLLFYENAPTQIQRIAADTSKPPLIPLIIPSSPACGQQKALPLWYLCLMKLSDLHISRKAMSLCMFSVIYGVNETCSFSLTEKEYCKVGHFSYN